MRKIILLLIFWSFSSTIHAQTDKVSVEKNNEGTRLVVNGEDFMVNGMNWDYYPIGKNFSYSLWTQPDDIVKEALDNEMSMLKNMGVNTIRVYSGIPKKYFEEWKKTEMVHREIIF